MKVWLAYKGLMITGRGGNKISPGNWYLGAGIWDPLFRPPPHFAWAESAHRLVSGPKYQQPRGYEPGEVSLSFQALKLINREYYQPLLI